MSLRDEILSRVLIGIGATAESIGQLLAGNDDEKGEDAPGVQGRAFERKIVKEVKAGEILAVDGRTIGLGAGRRALRVTRKLDPERGLFGVNESVTFMTVDVDTDEPYSFRAPNEFPLLVAVEFGVPDSVPADATGREGA
jgi:hypothetical protein